MIDLFRGLGLLFARLYPDRQFGGSHYANELMMTDYPDAPTWSNHKIITVKERFTNEKEWEFL